MFFSRIVPILLVAVVTNFFFHVFRKTEKTRRRTRREKNVIAFDKRDCICCCSCIRTPKQLNFEYLLNKWFGLHDTIFSNTCRRTRVTVHCSFDCGRLWHSKTDMNALEAEKARERRGEERARSGAKNGFLYSTVVAMPSTLRHAHCSTAINFKIRYLMHVHLCVRPKCDN